MTNTHTVVKDNGSYKNCKKIGELNKAGYEVVAFIFNGVDTWLFFNKEQ